MADAIRLNKWISHQGLASRREADRLIVAGQVRVNGIVVCELGVKIDPDQDRVEVAENARPEGIYIALHKPPGFVTTPTVTIESPRLIIDLVPIPNLFPVGRLDKDTAGLILLTNDGTLVTALNHPDAHKEKEYEVEVNRPIPDGALKHLEMGVPLFGRPTLPARIRRLGPSEFCMVLTEGRNRQIRRMCRKVGFMVVGLTRVRIDSIGLGGLAMGTWRHLADAEVADLKTPVARTASGTPADADPNY